jgi:choline-sulfatase
MPPDPVPKCGNMKPKWVRKREREVGTDEMRHIRRQYIAATELIDEEIGKILDKLEETGDADNTVIIFTGDHGEMLGDHGLFTKTLPYEAAMRIPMIVSGPDIKPGVESDALAVLSDLAPTICELAGANPLDNIHAQSLAPILRGSDTPLRDAAVAGLNTFRCVRTRSHKYIESVNDRSELYDLKEDPNETVNLIENQPDLASTLKDRLKSEIKALYNQASGINGNRPEHRDH